jgi:GT2 family glycosyltransferase
MNQFDAPAPHSPNSSVALPGAAVIIVSWNTRPLLKACLRSVFDSLHTLCVEIWVVDNASTDGSAEMVRASFPQVRLFVNDINRGFAAANNQALRQVKARYVVLLNSDTVVPPGALDALVHTMDAHPKASVCGPLLRNLDGTPQVNWARFPGLSSEWSGQLDRSQSPYPLEDFDDPSKCAQMNPFLVDWVGGACFVVRQNRIAEVGNLDEGYFMYSEETDWCRRFIAQGGDVLLVPSVFVTHLGSGSSRAVPHESRRQLWRSRLRFYRKMYGPFGALPASTLATARYLLSPLRRARPMRVVG